MKNGFVLFLCCLGFCGLLQAQETRQPGVAALNCLTCHHPASGGNAQIPSLVDFEISEITLALQGFRDGSKSATIMNRIAASLSDEQIKAIAVDVRDLMR